LTSSRQNKTKPDLLTKINIVTALAVITVEASVKLNYVVVKAASELRLPEVGQPDPMPYDMGSG